MCVGLDWAFIDCISLVMLSSLVFSSVGSVFRSNGLNVWKMKEAICDAQEMKAKIDKVQILAVDG